MGVRSTTFFIIPNNTKKNMEHLRIVKQKFSNKKTTLRKKLSQTETLALSQFFVAILFKICYPQKVYLHKFFKIGHPRKCLSARRMTKSFPKFLLISHIFKNFLNCLLYVRTLESRMF